MATNIESPFIREIATRSASYTPNEQQNSAKRIWRVVYQRAVDNIPNPSALGLPELYSYHPTVLEARLLSYDIVEDAPSSFLVTANYATPPESDASGGATGDEDDDEIEMSREWTGGETSRDLTCDLKSGDAVVLPTGEPFASVPSVPVSTMTFSVTKRYKKFDTDILEANCTVNQAQISIDGISVQPHAGLLSVACKKLYGGKYRYEVTFNVTIVCNKVKLTPGDGDPVDIGHDVALLLAGFKYLDDENKLRTATIVDEETFEEKPSSSPVLLKEDGKKVEDGKPYFKRFAAIKENSWSSKWFK